MLNMSITGTQIAYLHTCHRKLWLFSNGIQMEHTSDIVSEGKLIGEHSYLERSNKYTELEIEGIKIDYYDPKSKTIHEIKKSSKVENAHIAQVKYYLYVMIKNGIKQPSAVLEYPKLKQRQPINWEEGDDQKVEIWISEITTLIGQEKCPTLKSKPICKSCSYHDFCFIHEL